MSEHYGKIVSLLHYYKTHPQAKLFKNLKIRTETRNEILLSCPFIDRIKDLLADHCDKLDPEVVVEMNHKLELIRRVNEELRHVLENKEVSVDLSTFKEEPYNFNAVIKAIKLKFRKDKDVIDEIVKSYY